MFSEIHDLGDLVNEIQEDSRFGFSTVSFLRQAISLRENFMKGVFLCAGPPLCHSFSGSLDQRSAAASALRRGASRRVRAVVLDREAVVFQRP